MSKNNIHNFMKYIRKNHLYLRRYSNGEIYNMFNIFYKRLLDLEEENKFLMKENSKIKNDLESLRKYLSMLAKKGIFVFNKKNKRLKNEK